MANYIHSDYLLQIKNQTFWTDCTLVCRRIVRLLSLCGLDNSQIRWFVDWSMVSLWNYSKCGTLGIDNGSKCDSLKICSHELTSPRIVQIVETNWPCIDLLANCPVIPNVSCRYHMVTGD